VADAAGAPFGQEGSLGNGAAMRVAPLAVVATSLEQVVHLARESAVVTHPHPLGQDGAAVQAAAVFLALRSGDGPLDTDHFAAALAPLAQTTEFRRALELLRTVPPGAGPHLLAARLGNCIKAERSVPTAIAAFLAQPEDPSAAILTAVRCGGDTDTTAAMTGAIAGGRHGATALPPSWLARLEGADRLGRLGATLAQAAPARRHLALLA
jgi:poly(ADP-ribose) glycohydrolase ARH3